MTGQTHLIMLADMVIEGFVICGPEHTQGAEVCIYLTTRELHLCLAQGIAGGKIPKAHHPQVPKTVGVAVGHIVAILALAQEHDAVYGHFVSVGCPRPFCQLLESGPHLSVKLGVVATLQPQDLPIGADTKNTVFDDGAGVCFGHFDIGTVVIGVDGTLVCWHHLVALVGLEMV